MCSLSPRTRFSGTDGLSLRARLAHHARRNPVGREARRRPVHGVGLLSRGGLDATGAEVACPRRVRSGPGVRLPAPCNRERRRLRSSMALLSTPAAAPIPVDACPISARHRRLRAGRFGPCPLSGRDAALYNPSNRASAPGHNSHRGRLAPFEAPRTAKSLQTVYGRGWFRTSDLSRVKRRPSEAQKPHQQAVCGRDRPGDSSCGTPGITHDCRGFGQRARLSAHSPHGDYIEPCSTALRRRCNSPSSGGSSEQCSLSTKRATFVPSGSCAER
jgi:hypothetical protein